MVRKRSPVQARLGALEVFIFWPVGQAVKTPPFHGGNTGSNPVRVTNIWRISSAGRASALQAEGRRFEPVILHHKYAGLAQLVEHDRISFEATASAYSSSCCLNKLSEMRTTRKKFRPGIKTYNAGLAQLVEQLTCNQ